MFPVIILFNVVFDIIGGLVLLKGDSHTAILQNDLFDKMMREKSNHPREKRRAIASLKIQRKGSSITVSNNGRTFHYHGRSIANGMLQEFFGILPTPAYAKPLNDPLYLVSSARRNAHTAQGRAHSSSSYTSGREKFSLANLHPDRAKSKLDSPKPAYTSVSNSYDHPESKTTGRHRIPIREAQVTNEQRNPNIRKSPVNTGDNILNLRDTPVTGLRESVHSRQTSKTNYWHSTGDRHAPMPQMPRKPYVEYFSSVRNSARNGDGTGQQFSGNIFNIVSEDRQLFPQYGQQHLDAVPGLALYPSVPSKYLGRNKTLEPISEAIISGLHAQFFGTRHDGA